jgi:hypothetical protein
MDRTYGTDVLDEKFKILVRKPKGKGSFGRTRLRWDDNIKMDLKEIKCENVDWIHIAKHMMQKQALVNTIMNLWVT